MIKNIIIGLKNKFFPGKYERIMKKWKSQKGDKTLRVNYPNLNEKSIIFDVGGYEGQWASDIYSKYNCKIFIFEPVKEFSQNISKRFSKNKKIKSYNFGLSNITKEATISEDKDASSLYSNGKEKIQLISISEFIIKNKINKIDLLKLNVEGEEYNILNNLISTNIINKVNQIQVQFHRNIKNYKEEYLRIKEKLSKTHELTWCFPFIWENWKKKNV